MAKMQLLSFDVRASDRTEDRWAVFLKKFRSLVDEATQGGEIDVPSAVRSDVNSCLKGSALLHTSEQADWYEREDADELVVVYGYAGEWGELTSFWPASFTCRGTVWPSLEHFYQGSKFAEDDAREAIRSAGTCDEAHRLGKQQCREGWSLRKDWNAVRLSVMWEGLVAKFTQVPMCERVLAGTGNRPIVFADINDPFWGMGDGSGRNEYGKLLMEVRKNLRPTRVATVAGVAGAVAVLSRFVAERYIQPHDLMAASDSVASHGSAHDLKMLLRRQAIDEVKQQVRWRRGPMLGKGAFGQVHMGLNEVTGELMAVKTVQFKSSKDSLRRMGSLQREVALMKELRHPNIVQYYFSQCTAESQTQTALHIFLEYVSGGSIQQLLAQFGPLIPRVVALYVMQLLRGLHYLHTSGVVHRDIKGGNILMDVTGVCKLADFGTSRHLQPEIDSEQAKSFCGTPAWMAPEVLQEIGHDWHCDIWSLGCTVMEMLTAKVPWENMGVRGLRLMNTIAGCDPDHVLVFPDEIKACPSAMAFVQRCLHRAPKARPCALELYSDAFLRDVRQTDEEALAKEMAVSVWMRPAERPTGQESDPPPPQPQPPPPPPPVPPQTPPASPDGTCLQPSPPPTHGRKLRFVVRSQKSPRELRCSTPPAQPSSSPQQFKQGKSSTALRTTAMASRCARSLLMRYFRNWVDKVDTAWLARGERSFTVPSEPSRSALLAR